jgi:formamidopyrimidine-DNA glycosylase
MPELPEVETVRRGLLPLVIGKTIQRVVVRERRLRWPIANSIGARCGGQRIRGVDRRGKYLLFQMNRGALLVHLGMSGSLRYLQVDAALLKHDHFDIRFAGGGLTRFNDPRRFGSLHFARDPAKHRLICDLGPEPLGSQFNADYLHAICSGRKVPIKQLLMNSKILVGVGNIYANEALFRANIHPLRAAGRISYSRLERLVAAVRDVLNEAIDQGGTTLRDFVGGDGRPGYFKQSLDVYGRAGEACRRCGYSIRQTVIGQRATYYCSRCQR